MKIKYGVLITILLSIFVLLPLFHQGLFSIHDNTQAERVFEMAKVMKSGIFPVRWSPDLGYGYGYPLFNFYAPLPYYFASFGYLITGNLILATKLMFALGILLAGVGMYLLVFELLGFWPAILSAVLYTYAPYHAIQIYVRGAVGEYWAYGLIPWLVWSIVRLIKKPNAHKIIISVISCAGLILSHNIISLMFLGLLIGFVLILLPLYITKHQMFPGYRHVVISLILGLLLSCYFWLPALIENQYTNVSSITQGGSQYKDHFLYLDQLWDWSWGYAGSAIGRADGMSFKLGKIHILLTILGILSLIFGKKNKLTTISRWGLLLTVCLFTGSVFMTLPVSLIVWNSLSPIMKFFQFPWRFLVLAVFSISIIGSIFPLYLKKSLKALFVIITIISIIAFNSKYFKPQNYLSLNDDIYISEDNLKWTVSKISDEYLPPEFKKPENIKKIPHNVLPTDLFVSSVVESDNLGNSKISLVSDMSQTVVLNRSFFPSWAVFVNGTRVDPQNKDGLLSFDVPAGSSTILLIFRQTLVQLIADLISMVVFLFLIFAVITSTLKLIVKKYDS